MTLNEAVFITVPLVAFLCNLFLFLTLLSAKKSRLIYSFLGLLTAFMLWTAGSLFMRLSLYPGVDFWWDVSIVGIASVPLTYYLFMFHYTEQKGYLVKNIWIAVSAVMIILAGADVFVGHPTITVVDGEQIFQYHTHWSAVFAILYASAIFLSIIPMVRSSLKNDEIPSSQFTPLMIGVGFLFVGVVVDMIPTMSTLPNDTMACMLNAICMYYALYKKRLFRLTQLASRGPTYLISGIVTAGMLLPVFDKIESFFSVSFPEFSRYTGLIAAAVFALCMLLVFDALRFLSKKLFVKKEQRMELLVKDFSMAVNRTLHLDEIMEVYRDLLRDSMPGGNAFICIRNKARSAYEIAYSIDPMERREISIPYENPMIAWLEKNGSGARYTDFTRTSTYRSMWETEKQLLESLHISLILPICCDGDLVGFTLFQDRGKKRPFTSAEISYLESTASVLSIAVKNATLYDTINREARLDSLTELYNRRSFIEILRNDFEKARGDAVSLILFNMDDFKLYNELYGGESGDKMLRDFADILRNEFAHIGTAARYGGKEFAVILPFCDTASAYGHAQRVKEELQRRLAASGEKVSRFLTFSAGICTYPVSAATAEQLLSYANMAVDAAKKKGKNRILVYSRSIGSPDCEEKVQDKLSTGQEYMSTIYALTAAIDAKDHYTFSHSQNVSSLSVQLGEAYGLDREHLEIIRQAGLLHDIGKIGIPDAVLCKTSRLTPEEYEIMKQHVERSIAMIRHLPSLDYVIPVVIGHHERWDGKGYPRGISGESIPIGARCMAIADSFDAMVSRRTYKEPMPLEGALEEIQRNLGTQFDPELGQLFVRLVREGKIKYTTA